MYHQTRTISWTLLVFVIAILPGNEDWGTKHYGGRTTFIDIHLFVYFFFVLFVFKRGLILPSGFGSEILLAERLQ